MLIRKAYRFRLKTNRATEQVLEMFAGHCRFVWNQFWRINDLRLRRGLPIIRYQEMAFLLTLWKKSDERSWLRDVHSQVLQQKLMDLDRAYRDGFDRRQPLKRLPTLRKREQHSSFRYVQGFELAGRRMYLPKIGWVGFFHSQEVAGMQKNLTISKYRGTWFASVQVEQEVALPVHASTSAVGIDLGIAKLVTLSDGTVYVPQNSYRRHQATLAREQRKLAKKQKYSKNWSKQLKRVQRVHGTIVNARRDYTHKISDQISKNHATICIEDLRISVMSASARGTLEQPGTNVRAKSGLNKSILDQGWHELRRQLEYKSLWRGGLVIPVDPRYTSQTCSQCGHVCRESRPTQARFLCVRCGVQLNADVNAACNIKVRGLQLLAAGQAVTVCGELAIASSVKQKPVKSRKRVSPRVDTHEGILGL